VIVASLKVFNDLKDELSNLYYIPQFTDDTIFRPQQDKRFKHNVLFVGNTRGVYRESVKFCIDNNIDIDVYGAGWEKFIPAKYIKGNYIKNDELAKHYCNAKITLNDHWQTMRENGFISNRVFDVTACGGFLITDHFDEIESLFNGAVQTYSSEQEFVEKIDFYLNNHNVRKALSASARTITLEKHSTKAIGKAFSEVLK
jgi:spore maturation protein CgeB